MDDNFENQYSNEETNEDDISRQLERKSPMPKIAMIVAAVLIIGAAVYFLRYEALSMVSPKMYSAMVMKNTAEKLAEEINNVEISKAFKSLEEILSEPSEQKLTIDPIIFGIQEVSQLFGEKPFTITIKNDSIDKRASVSSVLNNVGDVALYVDDTNITITAADLNVSVDAKDPVSEIVQFFDMYQIPYEPEFKDMSIDMSYSGLEKAADFTDNMNYNFADGKDNPYVQEFLKLASSCSVTVSTEEVTINNKSENRKVTKATLKEADIKQYFANIAEIMKQSNANNPFNSQTGLGSPYEALEDFTNNYRGDISLLLTDVDNRYVKAVLRLEQPGVEIEVGAVGSVNMLDDIYANITQTTQEFAFSAKGNHVGTQNFKSEIDLNSGFESIKVNIDWDATKSSDNLNINFNKALEVKGTFRYSEANEFVVSSGDIYFGGMKMPMEKDGFKYSAEKMTDKINVPTGSTNLLDLNPIQLFEAFAGL